MQELDNAPVPARSLVETLLPAFKPFFDLIEFFSKPENVKAVRQALEDWERSYQEHNRALLAFTVNNCWIGLERHFTDEQLSLLMRFAAESGDDAANKRLPDFFRIPRIEEMVARWSDIPYLKCRQRIYLDAVEAYRQNLHTLVIPALLPLAEGLAAEIVPAHARRTDAVTRAAKVHVNQPSSDDFGVATLSVLEDAYYLPTDFTQPAPREMFNRHRILHGRIPDYASAANSIRAFLLVDTVADFWSRLSACAGAKP
jgi:hypothetical protein